MACKWTPRAAVTLPPTASSRRLPPAAPPPPLARPLECVRHLPGPKTGPAGFVFVGVLLTLSNYNVPFPDTLVEH